MVTRRGNLASAIQALEQFKQFICLLQRVRSQLTYCPTATPPSQIPLLLMQKEILSGMWRHASCWVVLSKDKDFSSLILCLQCPYSYHVSRAVSPMDSKSTCEGSQRLCCTCLAWSLSDFEGLWGQITSPSSKTSHPEPQGAFGVTYLADSSAPEPVA